VLEKVWTLVKHIQQSVNQGRVAFERIKSPLTPFECLLGQRTRRKLYPEPIGSFCSPKGRVALITGKYYRSTELISGLLWFEAVKTRQ